MEYEHYFQSDISIESETENVKFDRYIENSNKRFLQFVEGTLEEILPEDFDEGTTVIPTGSLYFDRIGSSIKIANNIKRVIFPDTITQIGTDTSSVFVLTIYNNNSEIEIVFPANIAAIKGCPYISSRNDCKIILDFSKAKKVPVITNTNSSFSPFTGVDEIRVPSSLYNAWTTSAGWSHLDKSKFVSV